MQTHQQGRRPVLAPVAGIAYNECMQYTVRGIPATLDKALRQRARAEGKSLNEIAVEALAEGLGFGKGGVARRDVSDIAGTWAKERAVERALAAQDRVDKALWK